MKKEYEALFTPWKIRNLEIKNRIVMCSMGGTSIFGWMEPNHFDKEAARFLLERARNNVGLILTSIDPLREHKDRTSMNQNTASPPSGIPWAAAGCTKTQESSRL